MQVTVPRRPLVLVAVAALAAALALVPAAEARSGKQTKVRDGVTTLKLDAGAVDALTSLGVSAAPIKPASASGTRLAFPVTSGALTAGPAGAIRHSGGIVLSKGSTHVRLRNFTIELDSTPRLTALVGNARVPILDLDASGADVVSSRRYVLITDVVGRLTATAAGALNDAFGVTAFEQGLTLGVADVVLDTSRGGWRNGR
jgi:hypothetical protein